MAVIEHEGKAPPATAGRSISLRASFRSREPGEALARSTAREEPDQVPVSDELLIAGFLSATVPIEPNEFVD